MKSVPGAIATGSNQSNQLIWFRADHPVATAPGTDLG